MTVKTANNPQTPPSDFTAARPEIKPRPRYDFLDVAKGITILIVVWYHVGMPFGYYANLFFMPLFFMISGLFFSAAKPAREFFGKNAARLLGPLAIGVVVGLTIEAFFYRFHTAKEVIDSGFYNFWLVGNVPLWFLLSLFYIRSITYIVERYVRGAKLRWTIYVLLSAIGYVCTLFQLRNTLFLGNALLSLPFFLVGFYGKDFWLSLKWFTPKWIILAIVVTLIGLKLHAYINIHKMYIIPSYFPSFFTAVSIVVLVWAFSVFLTRVTRCRFLLWLGQATIFIVIFHDLFVEPLVQYNHCRHAPFFSNIVPNIIFATASVLIAVVCVFMGKIAKRLFPKFFP